MKLKLYTFLVMLAFSCMAMAQQPVCYMDLLEEDIFPPEEEGGLHAPKKPGSFWNYYNNLNTWIPFMRHAPNEPLRNPPVTTVEISFHVFLDDQGGNNVYTDTPEGRSRLVQIFNEVNEIYGGGKNGFSHPIAGMIPLPDNDTRIRFSLGDNNERIYFYRNSALNKLGNNDPPTEAPKVFYNYLQSQYPQRNTKLNVYFTAGYYRAYIAQADVVITNGGLGYTAAPTITFDPPGAKATATIQDGKVTAITLTDSTGYHDFDPPTIQITGGGGSGATATVLGLSGGANGYANFPSQVDFNLVSCLVMCQSYLNSSLDAMGMTIAHELAHNLDLRHTYGADGPICNCNHADYLTDIFGTCDSIRCPHIRAWVNPYKYTGPDPEKYTNNLMGGSTKQHALTAMQAGVLHRALAIKSVSKYVKKETYSFMPLEITENQVWDFYLKLYRDIVVSSGAVLTLSHDFELPYNGAIIVKSGSALVIEETVKLSKDNKIIVENGGTLKIKSGATVDVSGSGYIDIKMGGRCCIEPNVNLKLNDVLSTFILRVGYVNGTNNAAVASGTCTPDLHLYPVTGNGKIRTASGYFTDLYIQNNLIIGKTYFTGRNIYIGREVRTGPQGNVVISNGAHVIFDAEGRIEFHPGFECQAGSTFEVRK